MVRTTYFRFAGACLVLLTLVGCSGETEQKSAECAQGATREVACGRYATSSQLQVCGPAFLWVDEGPCHEKIDCSHNEIREESCGGFNDAAIREQTCELGEWPDRWGPCVDPDVCTNGTVKQVGCSGVNAGLNGRATYESTCENGQWAKTGQCNDPDSCSRNFPTQHCDDNASCLEEEGSYVCKCDSGFLADGASCLDIDECARATWNDCKTDAYCVNTEGSYECRCDPGMVDIDGDGYDCVSVHAVALGKTHTCALVDEDRLFCWGENLTGELGDETTVQREIPTQVAYPEKWTQVAAGGHYTRALNPDESLFYWGGGRATFPEYNTGFKIKTVNGFNARQIAVGDVHTCAIDTSGRLYCWGENSGGQLGNGSRNPENNLKRVNNDTDWVQVAAGGAHTCALKSNGALYCWGSNSDGQLGDDTLTDRLGPVNAEGELVWTYVTAGASHTCAITEEQRVYCWGANDKGQLGLNTVKSVEVPTLVTGSANRALVVEAGDKHTCLISNLGALLCWGDNADGQLGDDTNIQRLGPTQVGTSTDWTDVRGGGRHTCGLREPAGASGGRLACWGLNAQGQLGDGTTTSQNVPTAL